MLIWIDRLSTLLGRVAGVAYFATGLMLAYEVFMRYVFIAPTIWAAELSQLCMIWGTWLAAAVLLHTRQHIRITIITARLPRSVQHIQETLVLLLVAGYSGLVTWYGAPLAYESLMRGRTTGTMLDLPMVLTEAAVPLGCALLCVQALVEATRTILKGPPLPGSPAEAAH